MGFDNTIQSSNKHTERLKDFFMKKTGIVVNAQQLDVVYKNINQRVQKRGFNNIDDYVNALDSNTQYADELKELIAQITINESYFFRDEEQMSFLEEVFFPQLIKKRRESQRKVLRIWSAGCSCGQEIYSIALILDKLIDDYDQWTIHLLGTDINTNVIAQGVSGKYTPWVLRNVKKTMLEKYFEGHGNDFILSEKIRKRVKLIYHNLSNDDYPSALNGTSSLDIIICRNVLLYIDKELSKKVLERFSQCLSSDGILLLGVVDIVGHDDKIFDRKKHNGVAYYQKASIMVNPPVVSLPISKKETTKKVISKHKDDFPKKVHDLLKEEKWEDLIALPNDYKPSTPEHVNLALNKALAFANIGRLDDAMNECNYIQKQDDLNAENYLIQALILKEKNNYEEAEKKIKQAIFLNKDFVDAYYCLGILYFRQNKIKKGLKEMKTAIRKIDQYPEGTNLYISPRVSHKQLKELLVEEINSYENDGINK